MNSLILLDTDLYTQPLRYHYLDYQNVGSVGWGEKKILFGGVGNNLNFGRSEKIESAQ